jgi:hypothetical protein
MGALDGFPSARVTFQPLFHIKYGADFELFPPFLAQVHHPPIHADPLTTPVIQSDWG